MPPNAAHESEPRPSNAESRQARYGPGQIASQRCSETERSEESSLFASLLEELTRAKEANAHDHRTGERKQRTCRCRAPMQRRNEERGRDPGGKDGAAESREQKVRRHESETTGARLWEGAPYAGAQVSFHRSIMKRPNARVQLQRIL